MPLFRPRAFTSPLLTSLLFTSLLGLVACSSSNGEQAASPSDATGTFSPDVLRADFHNLYEGLQAAHYDLFVRRPKNEYDAHFQQMLARIDTPLTQAQAQVMFQRFVAYGNIAHARIDPPAAAWEAFRASGGKAFPLYVRVDDDTVRITDDRSGIDGVDVGDIIESVNQEPALDWLRRLRAHVSADNDYMAWAQLERLVPLLVWLEHGEVDAFALVLLKQDGRRVQVSIPGRDRDGFLAAATDTESDWNMREARMLGSDLAYLRPGPFYDVRPDAEHPWDTRDFSRFLDEAFASFGEAHAKRLLIDLRDNPGGDNSFSDLMVAWFADRPFRFSEQFHIKLSEATIAANRKRLDAQGGDADSVSAQLAAAYAGHALGDYLSFTIPEVPARSEGRFSGEIFVLINRHSYSNAVLVAAIVQDYGFGAVLGEETSDLASTYGAMETFSLPLTGIEVGYPKARILRPSGDRNARGVIPDIAIPSIDEDAMLRQAIEIASGRAQAPAEAMQVGQ